MKKRYTQEQIISAIKEHEAGAMVDDICRSLRGAVVRIRRVGLRIRSTHLLYSIMKTGYYQ